MSRDHPEDTVADSPNPPPGEGWHPEQLEEMALDFRPGHLVRGATASFTTSIAIQGLNVATGVLLARSLGPAGKGILTAALLWPGILASIGGLGLSQAVAYTVAHQRGRTKDVCGTALALSAVLAMVVMLGGLFLIPAVLDHYGREAVRAGVLNLAWIPLTLLTLSGMGVLQGRMAFTAFNVARVSVIAATVGGVIILALAHSISPSHVILVVVTANALTLGITVLALVRHHWFGLSVHLDIARSLVGFGLRTHAGNISSLANERGDQALIVVFLAPIQLGLYSVAVTFTSAVVLVGASLAIVALPAIAGMPDGRSVADRMGALVRSTVLLSVLVSAVTAITLPVLVPLFFGTAFEPAVGPARVLLVAAVALSANRVLGASLMAINRPFQSGAGEIIATFITVGLVATLVPRIGILGAATASLVAYAVSNAYMVRCLVSHTDLTLRQFLVPERRDVEALLVLVRQLPRRRDVRRTP